KRRMKEALAAALVDPIDAYLAELKERLVATYAAQSKAAVAALSAGLAEPVDRYMEGLLAALADAADHERSPASKRRFAAFFRAASGRRVDEPVSRLRYMHLLPYRKASRRAVHVLPPARL
ncbi:hypothetical protein, partial [Geobacillus stearothermophilus]|uniref:hypothetical protein n=1 Tax=Geobacillus stearothermophilus TaxID=1422 RepID=UPI002E1BEB6D|nr:hypothetical protein [Geobacillus stearothermophilus]